LCECGDALGGQDCANMEAVMEQVWRCTLIPCSSEFGDALGGHDGARLEGYLDAVDGWCAGCWNSLHQLVDLRT